MRACLRLFLQQQQQQQQRLQPQQQQQQQATTSNNSGTLAYFLFHLFSLSRSLHSTSKRTELSGSSNCSSSNNAKALLHSYNYGSCIGNRTLELNNQRGNDDGNNGGDDDDDDDDNNKRCQSLANLF